MGRELEDIFGRAKSLGIKFDDADKKDLEHLSALYELLADAENQRGYLNEEGEDTTLQDKVIDKVRAETRVLLKKSDDKNCLQALQPDP